MAPAFIALAQFAPSILRFLGVGANNSASKITEIVSEVAKSVSGTNTLDEAITAFSSNTEKAYEFRIRMLSMDKEFEQMYLADVADARSRDKEFIKLGMTNARANVMFVLAVLIIAGMTFIIWKDPNINEYMKGIFTLVLGRFLGYLDNIYNFEFGTTRASKEKDNTISNLSKE